MSAATSEEKEEWMKNIKWVQCISQGDHLSGKPGNVRELYRCQGNVRNFTKSHGNVRELSGKNPVMEKCPKTFIIIASTGLDGTGFYGVIIMKLLSLNINLTVWSLPLTLVVQAWYEYQLKRSGVPQIVRENVRELSENFIVSGEWSVLVTLISATITFIGIQLQCVLLV